MLTDGLTHEQWVGPVPQRGAGAVDKTDYEQLTEAWRADPGVEQLFYLIPDLWPALSEPKILAMLQRFKDEREVDYHNIKVAYVVVPTLETLPEAFRPLFDIHYDTGLTEKQVREHLVGEAGVLKYINCTCTPEHIDEMVKLGVGLSSSDLNRMYSYAIVSQRKREDKDKFTPDGMSEWRKVHGWPDVT